MTGTAGGGANLARGSNGAAGGGANLARGGNGAARGGNDRAVSPAGAVLAVRPDGLGDVLLAGPAIRALAAAGRGVAVLASPRGRDAARMLPGVGDVITWRAPWIDPDPLPVRPAELIEMADALRRRTFSEAVIFTSFHQSPLPMALLLRMADVPRISAISEDYPGSLVDVRHVVHGDLPEPERGLSLARAAGFQPPPGDGGLLAVRGPLPAVGPLAGSGAYVVVHPGASAPARAPSPHRCAAFVRALVRAGRRVLVTGGPGERALTARVAGGYGIDLGGRTSLRALASVLAGAQAVVAPNTGAAHLAAAVGTPVVSLFAPVVPAARWAPYGVPTIVLGDGAAACADSRARICPVAGHPCLDRIDEGAVVSAVTALTGPARAGASPEGGPLAEAEVSA